MKIVTIISGLLLAVLAMTGCQSAETANTNAAANKTATDADKAGASSSSLKPETVSPDKPIPAGDLKEAVTADPNAWKGKEVSVVGNYISNAPTRDGNTGKLLSVQVNFTDAKGSIAVSCVTDKEPPPEYMTQRQDRVIRGKVKEVTSFGNVKLEPCQCVK